MIIDITGKKVCHQCGELKPLKEFHKCPSIKSGVHSRCKECHSFNCHLYYLEHTQQCKDNFFNWWSQNKEKHLALVKAWHNKNKWFDRYSFAKCRAKELGLPFDLKSEDVKKLMKSPKICQVTGKRLRYNKHHRKNDSACMCRNSFERGWTKRSVKLVSSEVVNQRVGKYNHKRSKAKKKEKK